MHARTRTHTPQMADDLLDDCPTKLPVLKASGGAIEVKRCEVFCSKIIHQRATHQSRFQWAELFRKIMRHAHPDCE